MAYKTGAMLAAALLSLGMYGCDVDVEDEGKLPDVDVDVEEGRMPEVEVRGPEVDIGTDEKTITVPDIDVDIPDEDDNEPVTPDEDEPEA